MVVSIDLVIHNILYATLSVAVGCMTEIQFMASKEVLCLDITIIPPLKSAHFLALVDFLFSVKVGSQTIKLRDHTRLSSLLYSEA